MASLFPLGLQVGQSPGADPVELNIDKPILSRHPIAFRDRDEHILSGLLDGLAAAFDLDVNNLAVRGTLTVDGSATFNGNVNFTSAFDFVEKTLIYSNV